MAIYEALLSDYESFSTFILSLGFFPSEAVIIAYFVYIFIKVFVICKIIDYIFRFFNILRGIL